MNFYSVETLLKVCRHYNQGKFSRSFLFPVVLFGTPQENGNIILKAKDIKSHPVLNTTFAAAKKELLLFSQPFKLFEGERIISFAGITGLNLTGRGAVSFKLSAASQRLYRDTNSLFYPWLWFHSLGVYDPNSKFILSNFFAMLRILDVNVFFDTRNREILARLLASPQVSIEFDLKTFHGLFVLDGIEDSGLSEIEILNRMKKDIDNSKLPLVMKFDFSREKNISVRLGFEEKICSLVN